MGQDSWHLACRLKSCRASITGCRWAGIIFNTSKREPARSASSFPALRAASSADHRVHATCRSINKAFLFHTAPCSLQVMAPVRVQCVGLSWSLLSIPLKSPTSCLWDSQQQLVGTTNVQLRRATSRLSGSTIEELLALVSQESTASKPKRYICCTCTLYMYTGHDTSLAHLALQGDERPSRIRLWRSRHFN